MFHRASKSRKTLGKLSLVVLVVLSTLVLASAYAPRSSHRTFSEEERRAGIKPRVQPGAPPEEIQQFLSGTLSKPETLEFIRVSEPVFTQFDRRECWAVIFTYRARHGDHDYETRSATAYIVHGRVINLVTTE